MLDTHLTIVDIMAKKNTRLIILAINIAWSVTAVYIGKVRLFKTCSKHTKSWLGENEYEVFPVFVNFKTNIWMKCSKKFNLQFK